MPDTLQESHFCPACGYDQRGISSDRCPECGNIIDRDQRVSIPWEQRKQDGYLSTFFRTLVRATFLPPRLAEATNWPMDLRSARIFRWIVRGLIALPCLLLYGFILQQKDGSDWLIAIDGPQRSINDRLWDVKLLWTAGAMMWPVLPIGFLVTLILSTGISHWHYFPRLELPRRSRAMLFSFYLGAPLAWIAIPMCILLLLAWSKFRDWSNEVFPGTQNLCVIAAGLCGFVIVALLVNSVRAISIAGRCGMLRTLLCGVGIIVQLLVSAILGLGLLPALIGLVGLAYRSTVG